MNRFFARTVAAAAMASSITAGVLTTASVAAADVTPAEQQEFIDAHNEVRRTIAADETVRLGRQVIIPDLVWSPEAAQVAQAWADQLAATNSFVHNGNRNGFGENLAAGRDTPRGVVGRWAAEAADYDYDMNTCTPGRVCGHYTQVVWAETTAVGCGIADHPSWGLVQVCNYVGHGNMAGERPYESGRVVTTPPTTPPVTPVPDTFDSFAAPIELAPTMSGRTTGSNIGATLQNGETQVAEVGGSSVHYSIVAPVNGTLRLSTQESDYDTTLGAGQGESAAELVFAAQNDDANNTLQSEVSIDVTAGQTYRIVIDGYRGAQGNHTLSWTFTGTPPVADPEPTDPEPGVDQAEFVRLLNVIRSQPRTCKDGDVTEVMPAAQPVAADTRLAQAAQEHSDDMARTTFQHTGSDGSEFQDRARRFGTTARFETISAWGTMEQAIQSWLDSADGHCQALMYADGTRVGIGYAENPNANSDTSWTHNWTLLIG